MPANDLMALLHELPKLVNDDEVLTRQGRFLDTDVLLGIGSTPCHIAIRSGRIASLECGPGFMRSWSFAVRGGENAWRQFWQPLPPPHFHDVFALAKAGEFTIEGDFYPLMSNILYFKRMLAAPRRIAGGAI